MSNDFAPVTAGIPIDDRIRRALSRGHLVDITTTGRRSGLPRRIEITFHPIDGRIFISGMPSRRARAWLVNLRHDPRMTFHLKGAVRADLPARARVIDDPVERRTILETVARNWKRDDVDVMVEWSPLIEVEIEGLGSDGLASEALGSGGRPDRAAGGER